MTPPGTGTRRGLGSVLVAFSLVVAADPAVAAKTPAHTSISAHLTPSTALIKTSATVSGTVSPAGGAVELERLVANKWTVVAHAKPSRSGGYTFSVRAPKTAASWSLRVIRAASTTTKPGVSTTLKLHVVTKQFVVAAASSSTLTGPASTPVTGVVAPAAGGTVQVQRLVGATWTTVATGKLGSGGTFSVSTTLPVGAQKLRVVKPLTTSIAQGISQTFAVAVSAPLVLAAPVVTTAALPAARVGVPYAALITASGGSGFNQWSGTGLPAGLTLSAAGLLAGTPAAQGTATITATVTDGAGHTGSGSLTLTTAPPAGRLFAVGNDVYGQLGNGSTTNLPTFVPVLGMTSVVGAASASRAGVALKSDGTVWTWGDNTFGQLGNGTTTASLVPVQVVSLTGVTAVAAGSLTEYALKADGTVWAWGGNGLNQIGDGTASQRLLPVQVSGLSSVVAVASGGSTAYALRGDGTVWAWGYNNYGQVGDNTTTNRPSPVQVAGLTGVKQIAAGAYNGYAVRSDGTAVAWGINDTDELGASLPAAMSSLPVAIAGLSQVTQVAGGDGNGYALTASGAVYGWGAGGGYALASSDSNPSTPIVIPTGAGAVAITSGATTAYALMRDGSVECWGRNDSGQCGTGTITGNTTTPTAMTGVSSVIAVLDTGLASTALLIAN